jgi:hypothetical protein
MVGRPSLIVRTLRTVIVCCSHKAREVTRIEVDAGHDIGTLNRNVFGGFVEHLGRRSVKIHEWNLNKLRTVW